MHPKISPRSFVIIYLALLVGSEGCVKTPSAPPATSPAATAMSIQSEEAPFYTPIPPTSTPIPLSETPIPPTFTPTVPTSTPTQTILAASPRPGLPFTVVHLAPRDGRLAEQLQSEAMKAEASGLIPVVYFDAPW